MEVKRHTKYEYGIKKFYTGADNREDAREGTMCFINSTSEFINGEYELINIEYTIEETGYVAMIMYKREYEDVDINFEYDNDDIFCSGNIVGRRKKDDKIIELTDKETISALVYNNKQLEKEIERLKSLYEVLC